MSSRSSEQSLESGVVGPLRGRIRALCSPTGATLPRHLFAGAWVFCIILCFSSPFETALCWLTLIMMVTRQCILVWCRFHPNWRVWIANLISQRGKRFKSYHFDDFWYRFSMIWHYYLERNTLIRSHWGIMIFTLLLQVWRFRVSWLLDLPCLCLRESRFLCHHLTFVEVATLFCQ